MKINEVPRNAATLAFLLSSAEIPVLQRTIEELHVRPEAAQHQVPGLATRIRSEHDQAVPVGERGQAAPARARPTGAVQGHEQGRRPVRGIGRRDVHQAVAVRAEAQTARQRRGGGGGHAGPRGKARLRGAGAGTSVGR